MHVPFPISQARCSTTHAPLPWLRRIGLINDYIRIPYANGSSFASQFLYRELASRGRDVTVIGPHDPDALPEELPPHHVALASLPLRNHPGVHLALPTRQGLSALEARDFDLILGQTSNALMDAGTWLRARARVPFVAVNTVHLPSVYNALLPDVLDRSDAVHAVFKNGIVPFAEQQTVSAYNQGDGLVVLSRGLARYWSERGVTVPIHVIPRAIDPRVFDRAATHDPFAPRAKRGGRLIVVCRHVREKGLARLLALLAAHVFPSRPDVTLTLVGDGPEHDGFRALAERLGIADRTFFTGEQPLLSMADYYAHADVFVYTSLSETYGQVVSEALYSGLPVVAFDDAMGVHDQVTNGSDGFLIAPGPREHEANLAFAMAVNSLLASRSMRDAFSKRARTATRARTSAEVCVERYFDAFAAARTHLDRARRRGDIEPEYVSLARWASVHTLLVGLGMLRPPAIVNRLGAKTPMWNLHAA